MLHERSQREHLPVELLSRPLVTRCLTRRAQSLVVPKGRETARACEPATVRKGDGSLVRVASAESVERRPDRERKSYVDWATLMRRSFGLDVLLCPECGGRMAPVAVITERAIIERILTHLKLPLQAAPPPLGGMAYDVTGEPMLDELAECEPQARGPPDERDFVDPPAPDD